MEKGTIGDTLTIENQFTKLSARELRSLSIEQLAAYRKCERANSLSTPPERKTCASENSPSLADGRAVYLPYCEGNPDQDKWLCTKNRQADHLLCIPYWPI